MHVSGWLEMGGAQSLQGREKEEGGLQPQNNWDTVGPSRVGVGQQRPDRDPGSRKRAGEGTAMPRAAGTSGIMGVWGKQGVAGGCNEVRRLPGEALGEAGRVLVLERAGLTQS